MWCLLFFFSSRRRHTRLQGDWSSDVCSSDLEQLILDYSAANRSAELVLPVHWVGVRKEVSGKVLKAWGIHLQIFKDVPVEVVGPGFGRVARHSTARVFEL